MKALHIFSLSLTFGAMTIDEKLVCHLVTILTFKNYKLFPSKCIVKKNPMPPILNIMGGGGVNVGQVSLGLYWFRATLV